MREFPFCSSSLSTSPSLLEAFFRVIELHVKRPSLHGLCITTPICFLFQGNNIFEHLSAEDYRTTIKILEHAILSTDLALYFQWVSFVMLASHFCWHLFIPFCINLNRKRGNFEKLVHSESTNWSLDGNRELLRAMMMTACDVAAITKPWEIQQQVTHPGLIHALIPEFWLA